MAKDPNLVATDNMTTKDQPTVTKVQLVAGVVTKRGAPPPEPTGGAAGEGVVLARITKKGHDMLHDGDGGRYVWNDEVALPRSVAKDQEDNGFAEIIG